MKTYFAKQEDFPKDQRDWYHVDASGQVLGHLAVRIATVIRGKDRPDYTPHVDMGPYIIVTNAEKIKVTGNKLQGKLYQRYTGYTAGQRVSTLAQMLEKHPTDVLRLAVRRMLPKSKLGRRTLDRLKIYTGPEHPHTYHKPRALPE